jgi:hypothetical protein
MKEIELFKIEQEFLKRQDRLLSVISFNDLELSPLFFEENEKLVDEYVYIDIGNHSKISGSDIREYIVKLKEGYFLFFSRRPNDSRYSLKVFFSSDKKYSDIIYQINRLNNIKK